jgi:RNA ligase
MNYTFPIINNIDDVLPHIKGREEFRVMDKGWYTVINYMVNLEDTFPAVNVAGGSVKMRKARSLESTIRRECRGLIFDINGTLISRPYHKFFNIGEKQETHLNKVNLNEPHVILEKLDGSMIRPILTPDGFRLATKAGVTDVSMNAENFIVDKPHYSAFINKCIQKRTTPVFEWISRKNRIVVDYPEDNLILTAIRHNNTGEYVLYDSMKQYAESWNIPVVKAISGNDRDIGNIVEHIRKWKDSEGIVIRFDSGYMAKIKSDDYVLRHKSKEAISQEKNILKIIIEDSVDDLIPILTLEDAYRLREFERAFWMAVEDVGLDIYDKYKELDHGQDQKEFAMCVKNETPKHLHNFMFSLRRKLPLRDLLVDQISKSLSTQKTVNAARWMFGDLDWNHSENCHMDDVASGADVLQ